MYGDGSFEAGGRAVADSMRRMGLSMDGFHIADGSGLSRDNRAVDRPPQLPALPPGLRYPSGDFGDADGCGIVGESPEAWALRAQIVGGPSQIGRYRLMLPADADVAAAAKMLESDGDGVAIWTGTGPVRR